MTDHAMDTDDKQCLFFDARGCGPSSVRLIERDVREYADGGKVIVPRAFGLCWEVTDAAGPLRFVEDGGFMLDAAAVDWLIAKLTAWRDAPRLAARETAEVVARDDEYGFRLLRTTAGEWGVLWQDNEDNEADGEIYWYATEAEGRAAYRDETGKVSCESCARFINHDDATVDGEGIYTCADESACGAGITEATP